MLYTTTKENEKNIVKVHIRNIVFLFYQICQNQYEIGTIVYVCIIKEIEQSKINSNTFL